ncbi:MAG TPA: ATP-binding protein [Chloroflexota bacterium]|nr:ATP-binding protein [Chloroflexota bacterium]
MALLRLRRRRSQQQALSPDAQRFALGVRTVADLVAPGAFDDQRDHIRLEYQHARTLVIHAYPRSVNAGWLDPLINFKAPLDIGLHLQPLETGEAVKLLTHKMVEMRSSQMLAERGGRLADNDQETAYRDAETLRERLQRGEEKVFSVSLYVQVRARSQDELDELTTRLEDDISGMRALSRVAMWEQAAGFRSCMPEALDELLVHRNVDTTSVATMFPFSSLSLSMENGVLYGIAKATSMPVILDPFDRGFENANLAIFAKSGAGKSYFCKLMALRNLYVGIDFVIIDPEDEYRRLGAAAGDDGQYFRLSSSSGQHLNPFDLPPPETADAEYRDPLAEQVSDVLRLLDVMLADPGQSLTVQERAELDRAAYETYAGAGITADPATHGRPAPLLRDFAGVLAGLSGEVAAELSSRLRRYVDGSLAGLFSGPTNVSLDKRFVVFNIQGLEEELKPLGIHLITSFIWNQVRRQRKPRMLILDEAWKLMQFPEGGAFVASLARRARKYYLGLVTITQDVSDFLNSDHGRTVLTNASMKLLLKQDSTTIEPVVRAFQLSDTDRQKLQAAAQGSGLLYVRNTHFELDIVASQDEHALATSAPQELYGAPGHNGDQSVAASRGGSQ